MVKISSKNNCIRIAIQKLLLVAHPTLPKQFIKNRRQLFELFTDG